MEGHQLHGGPGKTNCSRPAEGRLVHLRRKWLLKSQGNKAEALVLVLQFALTESLFAPHGIHRHANIRLSKPHFLIVVAMLARGLSPSQKPPAQALLVSGRSQLCSQTASFTRE